MLCRRRTAIQLLFKLFSCALFCAFPLFTISPFALAQLPDLVWMRGGLLDPADCIAYSSDGTLFATGTNSGGEIGVKIWRCSDGMLLHTIPEVGGVLALSFTSDGTHIVAVDNRPEIDIISTTDGSQTSGLITTSAQMNCATVSADGTLAATGNIDGKVQVWQASTGTPLYTIAAQTRPVYSLSFSPDDLLLASSGWAYDTVDLNVHIWNAQTGMPFATISQPTIEAGYLVTFSPVGSASTGYLLAVVPPGGGTSFYQLGASGSVAQIGSAPPSAGPIAFSPSGQSLAIGEGGTTQVVSVPSGNPQFATAANGQNPVNALAFSPNGSQIADTGSAWYGNELNIWNATTGLLETQCIPLPGGSTECLAASPDGKTIAVGGSAGVNLLSSSDGSLIHNLPGLGASASFSHDNTLLGMVAGQISYSPQENGFSYFVYRVADGSLAQRVNIQNAGGVNSCAITPDNQFLLTTTGLGLQEWSISAQTTSEWSSPVMTLAQYSGELVLSPDGTLLACQSSSGIALLKTSDLSLVSTISYPSDSFSLGEPAFSPDGHTVAANGSDDNLHLFRVSDGSPLLKIPANGYLQGGSPAYSPDGQVIAIGTLDGKLVLYSSNSGQELTQFDQETGNGGRNPAYLPCVTYSPDGKFIYYGRSDGTVCCMLNPFANSVFPSQGGNIGSVTLIGITPPDFTVEDGATIILTASGQPDVVAGTVTVNSAFVFTATFDLSGAPLGPRALVVTNPDGTSRTYPSAFTVVAGVAPQIITSIASEPVLRAGEFQGFSVIVSNLGNIDGGVADLRIEIPNWLTWLLGGGYQAQNVFTGQDNTSISVQVPVIPAGEQIVVPLELQAADVSQNIHRPFNLSSWADISSQVSLQYVGDLTEPRIIRVSDLNGDYIDIFGVIGPPGVVTGPGYINTLANGVGTTINVDQDYRPVKVVSSNGCGEFDFSYPSLVIADARAYIMGVGQPSSLFGIPNINSSISALHQPAMCVWPDYVEFFYDFLKNLKSASDLMQKLGEDLGALYSGNPWLSVLTNQMEDFSTVNSALSTMLYGALDILIPQVLKELQSKWATVNTSGDPNDLEGPKGFGPDEWVSGAHPLTYTIFFSNDPKALPAQNITVTDTVDPTIFDTTTLSLGMITIGDMQVMPTQEFDPPVGPKQYDYMLDLRPGNDIIAHIHASLDPLTGLLTYTFQSIDPTTGLPTTKVNAGVLPGGAQASVQFSVTPKPTVPTGTAVDDQATVVFDANPPMSTKIWQNGIDNTPPVSMVAELPQYEPGASFNVKWAGTDVGSGVLDYTEFVSDNGGPFTPWVANTTETHATFTGTAHHTYAFYSQARDNTFNVEPAHTTPDAITVAGDLTVTGLSMKPTSVVDNKGATGMVTLDETPLSDTTVNLTSSDPAVASVPTTVTVNAGATTATFPVVISPVQQDTPVTITATYGTSHRTAKITVTVPTKVTVASVAGNPGETVTLNATLTRTADGSPIEGQTVTFDANGTGVGSGTTNSSGIASVSYTIPATAAVGKETVKATFKVDSDYNDSSATETLTVR